MEKTNYNVLMREAEMVALLAHKNQSYDIFPYEKHLRDVVSILNTYGFVNEYICAGWLHDTIEDANLTYNKIKRVFGEEIAEMVLAVTDPIDVRNRKEKKKIVYQKIWKNKKAIIIKLADRIANTEYSMRMDNIDKISMYALEYADFKDHLYIPGQADNMWAHLDYIMIRKSLNT